MNLKSIQKIKKNANLILASNVFAHADDLRSMAESMLSLLSKKGVIIIEVQYLVNTLKDLTFDNIYHEHYNYWCLTSLKYFFDKLNANVFKAEKISTHGGSIRIYVSKDKSRKKDQSIAKILKEEEKFGIKKLDTYRSFAKKIVNIKKNVQRNLSKIVNGNKKIVGYGSPAKATTALNYFGISKEIDFIIEDNKLKHGKIIPGVNIPIHSKEKLKDKKSTIIVLAWNFFNEIKKNNSNLSDKFINIKLLEKSEIN